MSITFRVNLTLHKSELVGPAGNAIDTAMLSPDQYQTSPDQGRTDTSNRTSTISTWLPTTQAGMEALKHGDTFTLNGLQAIKVRNLYASGYAPADRAWLDVV